MAPQRATYTAEQKAHAVNIAAAEGLAAAHRKTGAKADTIRRWCDAADVTPADGRGRHQVERLVTKVTAGVVDAAAARSDRVADTQAGLGSVAQRQAVIVASHQRAAGEIIDRVNERLTRLREAETEAAELAAEAAATGDVSTRAAAARRILAAKNERELLTEEIEWARKISIATGVHVDKILRLAGEDSAAAAQGATAVNIQRVVGELLTNNDFRQAAIDRVHAMTRLAEAPDPAPAVAS